MFKNYQWVVTERGLTAILPAASQPYHIEAERLLLRREAGLYLWPMQVAAKTWVDFDAFEEAYRRAIQLFAVSDAQRADAELLEQSIDAARAVSHKRGSGARGL